MSDFQSKRNNILNQRRKISSCGVKEKEFRQAVSRSSQSITYLQQLKATKRRNFIRMNCSINSNVDTRWFLTGNFGASIFMATYIGFYGMGIIVYFSWQFMNDTKDIHEDELPRGFFSTLHHINERQYIYNQLVDKNWVRNAYQIYYSDRSLPSNIIKEKVNDCTRKYQRKIQHLQSKHAYYASDTTIPSPLLTTIAYLDE